MVFLIPETWACRLTVATLAVVALSGELGHAATVTPAVMAVPRVCSSCAYIRAMIEETAQRSMTFRCLVASTEVTNTIVYVEQGACGDRVRACLMFSTTPAGASEQPAFDVASVKLNATRGASWTRVTPDGIDYTRLTLRAIIAQAYGVKWPSISSPDSRIATLLDRGTFTIIAKAARPTPSAELMQMLQTLLADRFKLAMHREAKTEPVYKLSVATNGPRLKASDGEGVPMSDFSRYLTGFMGRVVLDETGLTGRYEFTLKLTGVPGLDETREAIVSIPNLDSDKGAAVAAMNNGWSSSSIISDIQKQLGLKLEAGRSSVDHLVIDHAETPTED